jgi:hypothetical protein
MKKFSLLTALLLLLVVTGSAQKVAGIAKGILQDSSSATALPDATVSVVRASDSSLISFTLTGPSGNFEVRNLEAGDYILMTSFTGLKTTRQRFTISAATPVADLGVLKLERAYKALDEVVITEAPVRVSGDTIAFKADAFKTKPNATVEDLLKKLPGVQVERDGTVKAQGETVQKVYVDGKEFFSNDPKMATKNLTADMVDQVEVYDDMSEQAKFNGIDDGSRSKAINLKLKKDKKKGLFGKAYAGGGRPGERFDMGANANMFRGAMQTSLIARNNSNNSVGFTLSDFLGTMGGLTGGNGGGGNAGGGFGGGGMGMGGFTVSGGPGGMGNIGGGSGGNLGNNGITKAAQVGLNYRDTWSRFFDINGSYSFNHINTDNEQLSYRQTFLTDSTLIRDGMRASKNENDNHRLNMNLVYTVDSFNSIIYNPNLNYQKTFNTFSTDSISVFSQKPGGDRYLANQNLTRTNTEGDGYNWVNNLIWRHRFRKKGRTLAVTLGNTLGSTNRSIRSRFDGRSFNPGGFKWQDSTANVLNRTDGETENYSAAVSYTEPIGRDKVLEFNYGYTRNRSRSERVVLGFDPATEKYAIRDERLSNSFENQNSANRFGTNLRVVKKKYNYQFGFAAQLATLEGINLTRNTTVRQTFTNVFPTASFNYQFARSRSLRFNYRGNTRQPNVTQLQEVPDVSNPQNVYIGNPGLSQEFTNNFTLSYNFFDIIKFRNLFAFITFSNTNNKIANAITQRPTGEQVTRPVNLDGAYTVSGVFNIGFPIKKLKGGNFNTNTRATFNRDVNMINNVESFTKNFTLGEDLRLSYNWKEKLDLGIGISTNYTSVRYTNLAFARNNQTFFTHVFSGDITYTFPKGFSLSTDFDYTMNTGRTDGFNQNVALWNASVAKDVFKNRKGEIRFSVYDILNRNASVNRTAFQNFIEDTRNLALRRFYMLTFTYRLNQMGGRSMPRMVERATRGMRVQ